MASETSYRLETLAKHHDRDGFSCGVPALDAYLKTQASQDMKRKANAVFVLAAADTPRRICGYFTLCAYGIAPGTIPENARKYIPRYPVVSATLIGRLAIIAELKRKGLGSLLLAKALQKAYENAEVAGFSMVVVDAIDDGAVAFYQAHGFMKFPESMRLILPMRAIAEMSKG